VIWVRSPPGSLAFIARCAAGDLLSSLLTGVGKSRNVSVDGHSGEALSKEVCSELVLLAEPGVLPSGEVEAVVEQAAS
jgi:hypothetical protein